MRRLAHVLFVAFGLAVVAALLAAAGPRLVAAMLWQAGWSFAAVAGLYAVHQAVRAAALWRALPQSPASYLQVLRVRFSGETVEALTFTGPLLAEPAKGLLLQDYGVTVADAFAAVALEYLMYVVVSSWLSAGAFAVLLGRGLLPRYLVWPAAAAVAAMLLFTLGFFIVMLRRRGLVVGLLRRIGAGLGREHMTSAAIARIAPAERVLVGFLQEHPGRSSQILALEGAAHGLLALEIWVVLLAVRHAPSLVDCVIIEGGIKVVSAAFFFVPGQLGAAEGGYAVLASAIHLPAAFGLTLALVRRVRTLVVAVPGIFLLRRPRSTA